MKKVLKIVFLTLLAAAVLTLLLYFLSTNSIAVFDPKGIIALQERNLIIFSTFMMLLVVIPVYVLTIYIPWKYRESNAQLKYTPNWDNSYLVEAIWWGIPCIIILVLSILAWNSSHDLDPFKPLASDKKPLTIQVVALQWKWLFIYPEQKIATVNFVQFPEKTPINFQLTAQAPMNSFWIPQLSGQVYAMPGMKTELNLMADEPGEFRGSSANLSGIGFAGMYFTAKSSSQGDFEKWIESVKQSPKSLNMDTYNLLARPSSNVNPEIYLLKEENLFNRVFMKYMNNDKK